MKCLIQETADFEPMTRGAYNKKRGRKIPQNENPEDEGYSMTCQDGRVSWLPRASFEKVCRECDTPLDRMAIENEELLDRMEKLEAFTKTDRFKSLPDFMKMLMQGQLGAMKAYNSTLMARFSVMNHNVSIQS